MLRFLLLRRDIIGGPRFAPFTVRIRVPYKVDDEQTTPYKTFCFSFADVDTAEVFATHVQKLNAKLDVRGGADGISAHVCDLPEIDFTEAELKLIFPTSEAAYYAFLGEVLEDDEHAKLFATLLKKLSLEEWSELAKHGNSWARITAAIEEYSDHDAVAVYRQIAVDSWAAAKPNKPE